METITLQEYYRDPQMYPDFDDVIIEPQSRVLDSNVLDILDEEMQTGDYEKFIYSALPELQDQRIACSNPQEVYATEASQRHKLAKYLAQESERALDNYMKANPGLPDFKVVTKTFVISKALSKLNYKAAYSSIMSCLLDRKQSFNTQKAILDYVKLRTGIQELNANLWTIKLKPFAKQIMQKRIDGEGLKISLKGCSTLSDVRKACSAYFTRAKAELKATVRVNISDDALVIGNLSYPIITSKVGKSTYRRVSLMIGGKKVWQRLDVFEHLVINNKSKK